MPAKNERHNSAENDTANDIAHDTANTNIDGSVNHKTAVLENERDLPDNIYELDELDADKLENEDDISDSELIYDEAESVLDIDAQPEEDIGKKINQLRLAKGYSQRKLARMAGVTNTSISAIERNKVSPAVNTLKAILLVLGSDLTTFFSDEWKAPKARVVVTPKDLIELSEPSSRVSLKQVYNCSTTKNLGFLIETYQPNSSTEEKITHEGEEIGTVIEGKVLIRIEEMTYLLNEGDSYVIDTSFPHTFINPTDAITRVVSAHTPTTY